MRDHRPSWTARAVALSRALASGSAARSGASVAVTDPKDAMVRELLPPSSKLLLRGLEATGLTAFSARASLGLVDHIALRAAIIDREVEQAIEAGLRQAVILGAGLDTRAHRLAALHEADVYELDFPSTQAEKQAAAGALPRSCKSLRYVPIDFERDEIGERLASSGHDPARPTLWLLEGVAPYLTMAALARLLQQVSHASAQGSILVLSYVPDGMLWMKLAKPAFSVLLRIVGEPLKTPLAPALLHRMLERHGLRVVRDLSPREWARAIGASERNYREYARLSVAEKS